MKQILITGATGFIGQNLVTLLRDQNYKVRALVRNEKKAKLLLPNVELISGDLTDVTTLQDACQNVDTIFHLAGHAHAWQESDEMASRTHQEINFDGTRNLCQAAINQGVRGFVYFSTVKAVADANECTDEFFDQPPSSHYGVAKRQAELFLLAMAEKFHLHVSILRPTLVYGVGVKGNIAKMIRGIDRGYFPPLPKVLAYRSMVSVKDICRAALLVATHPQANGKIYIVSDGRKYTARGMYEVIMQAFDRSVPAWSIPLMLLKILASVGDGVGKIRGKRFVFDHQALVKLLGAAEYNSQRIFQELGFTPQETFEMILPEMIKEYKNSCG